MQEGFDSFFFPYEMFKDKFLKIKDLRDQALVATIYCGYARVGEIVKGNYKENPAVAEKQVTFTDDHMILNILTEKTMRWRTVYSSSKLEGWLHDPIKEWIETKPDKYGEFLFPLTTRWAELRFQKCWETQHIHLLRHWACTHALQGKRTAEPLSISEIAVLGGWIRLNILYRTYSHLLTKDFAHKI